MAGLIGYEMKKLFSRRIVPFLLLAMPAAFGCVWLLLRRSKDDYGRDHYNTVVPWCAAWARNAWGAVWLLLAVASGLEISRLLGEKDFTADDGSTLGTDGEITFKTLNQSRNNMVYMVMMFLMFGGMFFFTSRQMKKHMAEENEGRAKEEPFNPYKEAKKTGKSVSEVIAEHEKEVAKKAAKEARHAKNHAEEKVEEIVEETNGNYRVKGPRPISAGGSSYITGRKAIAEAKKAEEERLARRRAAAKKKKKK